MGNILKENEAQPQLFRQYQQVRKDSRGHVLSTIDSQQTFLLKQYSFCSEQTYKNKLQQIKQQIKKGQKDYIISPVKVQPRTYSSFCSTVYRLYVLYEYPQVTLKEQISARQRQNKLFQQPQLWSILQSCTNALVQSKPIISLSPNQVFINPDGHLKILHEDLVDQNYRVVCTPQIFYAPQKIKNFTKNDSENTLRKQSIFSLGMTLLEAAQLSDVLSCYDYQQSFFHEDQLQQMIQSINQRYSQELIQVMRHILQVNPNRRASLMEVQKALQTYWNSQDEPYYDTQSQQSRPLTQKNSNGVTTATVLDSKQIIRNQSLQIINKLPLKLSARKYQTGQQNTKIQKEETKQLILPQEIPIFKLQKPVQINYIQTPKNAQPLSKQNLYTDPRLLEMIKKDLNEINKLKKSNFVEPFYVHKFSQANSLLNSLKKIQGQNIESSRAYSSSIEQQQQKNIYHDQQNNTEYNLQYYHNQPVSLNMKKQQPELIFTVQQYENGSRYQGTILNGKKHGKGKLIYEDGAYYEGQFKDDKMNGYGVLYYYQNYPAYDGQWTNDQFNGKGILFNQYPQKLNDQYDFRDFNNVDDYWIKYEGDFVYDLKCGHGVLYLSNGQIFNGTFVEDELEGQGIFITLQQQKIQGVWSKNNLIHLIQ